MKRLLNLALLLCLFTGSAYACSPVQEMPFEPESAPIAGEIIPIEVPAVRVHEVHRGRLARTGESSCEELAYITLAIRDPSPSLPFAYSFELIEGDAPDHIFYSGHLYVGGSNGKGDRLFSFHWPDLAPTPEPFRVRVKVTPHSRSGTPGPSAVVTVESEG